MKTIVTILLKLTTSLTTDEEAAEDSSTSTRLPNYDFNVLTAWYQDYSSKQTSPDFSENRSPRKAAKTAKEPSKSSGSVGVDERRERPPIVVILQDFEAFEVKVGITLYIYFVLYCKDIVKIFNRERRIVFFFGFFVEDL